jgi:hypothetical protein
MPTTLIPRSAKSSAVARPIPELAPVTIATFSCIDLTKEINDFAV